MRIELSTTGIEYWEGISDAERLAMFNSNEESIPSGYEDNELRFIPFFKLPNSVKAGIYETLALILRSPSYLAGESFTH